MPSEAEAREWWSQREVKVEKELASAMQKRIEAQRAQIHAFKLEQSKWEHELQVGLRIFKYAHDRKLLSEHNIELQEALTVMEEKFEKHQQEMDIQTARIVELEGMLHDNQTQSQLIQELRENNRVLSQRLVEWEQFHQKQIAAHDDAHKRKQEELLDYLERELSIAVDEDDVPNTKSVQDDGVKQRRMTVDARARRHGYGLETIDADTLQARVVELEKLCKHKDQQIHSLKTILERQEKIFDQNLKLTTAKYDQVKAINIALQKRLLDSLTESISSSG